MGHAPCQELQTFTSCNAHDHSRGQVLVFVPFYRQGNDAQRGEVTFPESHS